MICSQAVFFKKYDKYIFSSFSYSVMPVYLDATILKNSFSRLSIEEQHKKADFRGLLGIFKRKLVFQFFNLRSKLFIISTCITSSECLIFFFGPNSNCYNNFIAGQCYE